jgi:hypothetical protein
MVWPKQTTANADVPTRVIRVERIFFPNPIARHEHCTDKPRHQNVGKATC